MTSTDTLVTRWISQGLPGFVADMATATRSVQTFEKERDRAFSSSKNTFRFSASMGGSDKIFDVATKWGAGIAGGLAAVGAYSLKARGQVQLAEIGFSKSLGSIKAAQDEIADLKGFDRESPFDFRETIKGAMRLQAVGFAAKNLRQDLTDIGDATTGTGGDTGDFMGIGRALGQMKSKGRVSMEEINQLADRNIPALQILQKQLKLTDQQVSDLMNGQYTIKSSDAIPALLKGFRELYGGSMKEGAKTIPGQIQNLNSALFQLGDTLGGLEVGSAGTFLEVLTKIVDKTDDFAKANPGKATGLFALVGGGAALTAGLGVIGKAATGYQALREVTGKAAKAKDLLAKSTLSDIAAEKMKTGVAKAEGDALQYSATAAQRAAAAKAEAEMAAEDAAAALKNSGEEAVKSGGRFNAFKSALKSPYTFRGMSVPTINAFGQGGGQLTKGGAAVSAALGAVAAYQTHGDMRALGYTEGQSSAYAAVTGVATTAMSAVFPPARLIFAAAELFSAGVDKFYNQRLEKAAEQGTGTDNEEVYGKDAGSKLSNLQRQASTLKTPGAYRAEADQYVEMSAKARDAGDEETAELYLREARKKRHLARMAADPNSDLSRQRAFDQATANYTRFESPEGQAQFKRDQEKTRQQLAVAQARLSTDYERNPDRYRNPNSPRSLERPPIYADPQVSSVEASTSRHGTRKAVVTITMPESTGDAHARKARYNTQTVSPTYR